MPSASDRRPRNLAALAQAGLPTPGGCCLTAAAYRRQIAHLGLADAVRDYADADPPLQRRLVVEIRLKLYQGDLAPELAAEILAAWRDQPKPLAVRSSALIEDRADTSFAGQFESFLGHQRRGGILDRVARLLGGTVDHQRAALHGAARP